MKTNRILSVSLNPFAFAITIQRARGCRQYWFGKGRRNAYWRAGARLMDILLERRWYFHQDACAVVHMSRQEGAR